eukprot:1817560-Ditylum_brightwellii.AAC.1
MHTNLCAESFANHNPELSGILGNSIIGEGKYKVVKKGSYDCCGAPVADKVLKTGTAFSSDYFLDDVHAAEAALPYIAAVWYQGNGRLRGQKVLREPYINNSKKFNSNSSTADVTATVAQALSHFSYHASNRRELLCDLQGGKVGESCVFLDVVLMSKEKKYSNTDLGETGIENWLSAHRCNKFCSSDWKNWSGAQNLIEPQEYIRIRPSKILLNQDSIKDRFQDGHTLLQTALQIAQEEVGKGDIPLINVVKADDGRFFALDNCRLAVFQLLEIYGQVGTIKVEVVTSIRWKNEWNHKVTTTNGSKVIVLRPEKFIRIGRTEQESQQILDWLHHIRNARSSKIMPDLEFSVFLGTFTDE